MKELGGILGGTDQIIDQHLLGLKTFDRDGRSYQHKGEASNLKHGLDAESMLGELVKQIRNNLLERDPHSIGSSSENWREDIRPYLDEQKNTSKEIVLERKIAQALRALEEKRKEKSNWWNQMPIASGLVSSIDDRRRAIDLVHRHDRSGKRYDFVELKIDSDTPLFALMEILRYGNVYLVLRESRDWLPEVSRALPVFNAEHVGLRVLAPKIYYGNLNLYWLQEKINLALPQIIKEYPHNLTLTMDISSHWPTQLEGWDETILSNDSRLLSLLNKWNPAYLQ
jgi:hypothetical protein